MKRSGMKPLTTIQREKVLAGPCRGCGRLHDLDGHHTITRRLSARPDARDVVIPLCRVCHQMVHEGKLDLLSRLTEAEAIEAVRACDGRIARAYRILNGRTTKGTE